MIKFRRFQFCYEKVTPAGAKLKGADFKIDRKRNFDQIEVFADIEIFADKYFQNKTPTSLFVFIHPLHNP
jgi:hypothetical protein